MPGTVLRKGEGEKQQEGTHRAQATTKWRHKKTKILQANLNRSRQAQDLTFETAIRLSSDLIIITEPNIKKSVDLHLLTDNRVDCAIINVNKDLPLTLHRKADGWLAIETDEFDVYNIYCSPNADILDFKRILREIETDLRLRRNPAVILGDFNAKSIEWEYRSSNKRGQILAEWASSLELILLNTPDIPTFQRGSQTSVLDLAFITKELGNSIYTWRVLNEELLSDHLGIDIEIQVIPSDERAKCKERTTGWIFSDEYKDSLAAEFRKNAAQLVVSPLNYTQLITKTCDDILKRKKQCCGRKRAVYWWTGDIAAMRKECLRQRRKLYRCKGNVESENRTRETYKEAKRALRKSIIDSKKRCWQELIAEADTNVWGNAYKIVTKKFLGKNSVVPQELIRDIIKTLFPTHEDPCREIFGENLEVLPFTLEELAVVVKKVKKKKSPGPDGITPEILITIVEEAPDKFLTVANEILQVGEIPTEWKKAKLVLIPKKGKPLKDPSAYRPICLLNTTAKLLEHLINTRLREFIEERGLYSPNQFGFRPGLSTINALIQVLLKIYDAVLRPKSTLLIPCLVTVDVKNAFNSASWDLILRKLRENNFPEYLRRIVQSYLEDRSIEIKCGDELDIFKVNSGVPQGSVLGPTLWNFLYNSILCLDYPEGVSCVAYADDLALVVVAKNYETLEQKINTALTMVKKCLEDLRLEMAPEKTEVILPVGKRKIPRMNMRVGENSITRAEVIKYLGIWVDQKRNFGYHVTKIAEKATAVGNNLARMLPNLGGPREKGRKLIAAVVTSTMCYGIEVWADALKIQKYRQMLESIQRKIALRVISAYRTVSTKAALVLAGIIPIHLLAEERIRRLQGQDAGTAREETIVKWQGEWDQDRQCWTRKLIPSIKIWLMRNHGELEYFTTQFITGHGCFWHYLAKFGIKRNSKCPYCCSQDTPAHTIFECERWEIPRRLCFADTGPLSTGCIVTKMLESKDKWSRITEFIKSVIEQKCREERQMIEEEDVEEEEEEEEL